MKFAILLLAFFIPLLTSTGALTCYQCEKSDCSNSNGVESECDFDHAATPEDTYCYTYKPDYPGKEDKSRRGCKDLKDKPDMKSTCKFVDDATDNGNFCTCNTDLCNGSGVTSQNKIRGRAIKPGSNSNTRIVGMSVTTLLGGVLALSLLK